jgi:hypothetical protein
MMRASHNFLRIEALGPFGPSGRSDLADPLKLEVRVTRADDLEDIIESGSTEGLSTTGGGIVQDPKKPFRLVTGVWAFDLDETKYLDNQQYVIHFRYEMTPGNLKVDRVQFTHRAVPVRARESDGCIVTGVVLDTLRRPLSEVSIILETYRDFITLSHRTATAEVRTDAFGSWWVELKQGQLIRFVLGELAKVIVVPDDPGRVSLSQIPDWQPADVRKDKFGYPYP